MTRVAIVQSNYIPWKGYFDLINLADEFVLLDTVQYTRRDWRNRNRVKTRDGPRWLTIPVRTKGRFTQRIDETVISDPEWARRHWRTLVNSYSEAACFGAYEERLEELYLGCTDVHLSRINERFIVSICDLLGISTPISFAPNSVSTRPTSRLVEICRRLGGTEYLSGPSARGYLDEEEFRDAGIAVRWMDYSGYPEYPQLFPPFEHGVSVLDLILNTGPDAGSYMKSFRGPPATRG